MRTFPVERVVLVEGVERDPRALRRALRLAAALGVPAPPSIARAALAALRAQRPACRPHPFPRRTGAFDYGRGWTVALDTYVDAPAGDAGLVRTTWRDGAAQMDGEGVCRSALELHGAFGCVHRCAYCFCDNHFLVACDLETLADRIPGYVAERPAQRLYKFDNMTDTLALEPEYGASELLVPLFAELPRRYLLLYTKSDNVEHLLPLRHGGHTIVNWSLSPLTQSRAVEQGAPDVLARIEAMRRCAAAGYTVRARFSPIVPLEGWRTEMAEAVDTLFAAVTPDLVTLDVVGWCQPEALADALDVGRLEAPFREALRTAWGTGNRAALKYLFPHALRADVLRCAATALRRRAPGTPVALCNETRAMWHELADVLTMGPADYACCCGPDSVPGHPWLPGGPRA